ncbi:MAG: methyl-accepting chemotaxis protein/ligand-binding sensor domain-containing protein [Cyclobacteriaceae bacterium]|jgi:methyl-accepting chemotaxis protein/ligand-binding sensor domain-containing protein
MTIISAIIMLAVYGQAQDLPRKFRQLTTEQGLSTGTVNTVLKDSKGFVWIGTINGLNRYDGYNVSTFKSDPQSSNSISGNIIKCMVEAPDGKIWVGTRNNGINIFDWETDSFSLLPESGNELPKSINKIFFINDKEALIATQGQGLCVYNLETGTSTCMTASGTDTRSISNDYVFDIKEDAYGNHWISTHSGKIDLFNNKTKRFTQFVYNPDYAALSTTRKPLLFDKEGQLWIGTDGDGVYVLNSDQTSFKRYSVGNGLSNNIITCLYQDPTGRIFIGTDGNGIDVFNPKNQSFTKIQKNDFDPESLSSDAIYDIYEDNTGVLWISTFRGGVNIASRKRSTFTLHRKEPGNANSLSFNSVVALENERNGSVWVGTDGGGLDLYDPETGRFRHYRHDPNNPRSISGNVAIALLQDRVGMLWIGTYAQGLNRLDPRTGNFERFMFDPSDPTSLGSRNVWDLLEDKEGNLWIGLLDGGLDRYDRQSGQFIHYTTKSNDPTSISSNLIFKLYEDSKGNFWVGTEDQGLNLFNKEKGTFRRFQRQQGDSSSLTNNNIRTLYEFQGRELWIGTSEGINILDLNGLTISHHALNKQLPSKVINSITGDKQNNLWISHNNGLSRYNPISKELTNFGKEDGLQGLEYNYNTVTRSPTTGKIYFGGINGLNEFDPVKIQLSDFNVPVEFSEIKINNLSLRHQKDEAGQPLFDEALSSISKLNLAYDQNLISLEFVGLDYNSPNSNKYKYMLQGFDTDWNQSTSEKRMATYTNLDAGTYTFKVTATNSDGVWSSLPPKTLEIRIAAAWWATWWTRGFVLILIVATLYFSYKRRINSMRAQRNLLKQEVENATKQMQAQNQDLLSEQDNLEQAIEETNQVVRQAVESGNFSARIDLEHKEGEWKKLAHSINQLFDSIIIPFNNINKIIDEMSQNNLSVRYTEESKGDILRLTQNLNGALESLSELLLEIKNESQRVEDLSITMHLSSEEMMVSTDEIASSIDEMANGAQSQQQKIDESSRLLASILELSNETANSAKEIDKAAETGVLESEMGRKTIKSLDQIISTTLISSNETNTSIALLTTTAQDISSVLSIIQELTAQTTLLALNASIEAAKAGDAGRGFAVVATQIKKLAQDSANSTEKINKMIGQVQHATKDTEQHIQLMNKHIKQAASTANDAADSFGKLATNYDQTLNLSRNIVKGAEQQTTDISKVVKEMEAVVVVAEETAAGTEQIATSAAEMSSGMTEYAHTVKQVKEIAVELQNKTSKFTL